MTQISISPKTRDVLKLLGAGVVLTSLFMMPGAAIGIQAITKLYKEFQREKDLAQWDKFNLPRLRYLLKRMILQKYIRIKPLPDGSTVLTLTKKGLLQNLKYNIETMDIAKPKKWDGSWRLIMYDISRFKKREQEIFRRMLKKFKMLQLQKSVYLFPYPCENEIEFLRGYLNMPEAIMILEVSKLENESYYRRYFGI